MPNSNGLPDDGNKRLEKKRPARKQLSGAAKFFITLGATMGIFLVAFTVFVGVALTRAAKNTFPGFEGGVLAAAKAIQSNLKGTTDKPKTNIITDLFAGAPEITNFAVFGTDEGGDSRTDVMMVAQFNSKTEKLVLLSVPRDTYTVMSEDKRKILTDAGRFVPKSGVMKMNEVAHYAGRDYAMPFAVKQIEELLGIEIEYYVRVDLDAFRFIVDEIGGVTFDVPQRMYYNDPYQGLYIDLQPGMQTLNGKQAEGLVRYRKHDLNNPLSDDLAGGDLGRVKIQQDFVKALVAQAFSKKNIVGNLPAFAETIFKYVDTNFSIGDVAKYAGYALSFKKENVTSFTLPGTDDNSKGPWYFIVDEEQIKELVSENFR